VFVTALTSGLWWTCRTSEFHRLPGYT